MRNIMKNKNNLLTLASLTFLIPSAVQAFSQEKDGIKISVKDFMNDPYAQVISNPNWTITAEDLQKHNIAAIKVKVTNNTDKPICISGRSVKLSQTNLEDLAAKFKKRAIVRPILAYFGAGIVNVVILQQFVRPVNLHPAATFEEGLLAGMRWGEENAGLLQIDRIARLAGAIAYGYYLSDLNNQLDILVKQSALDEMTTIAPNQSVEKVILCEGMLSQNFKFNIFNRSHVPVAEFAVDLNA